MCGAYMKNLYWDEPIQDEFKKEWIDLFRKLFQMEDIIFQRCIKPDEAIGDPILALFSDRSKDIIGICGSFVSSLIASKTYV